MILTTTLFLLFTTWCTAVSPFSANYSPLPKQGKWTTLPSIPLYPRQEHTTVAIASSIYIIGGVIPFLNNETFPTVTLVQRYSIPTQTWRTVASLPLPLNHANAVVLNNKIYVLGGLTPQNGVWNASRACFEYDPDTDAWSQIDQFPEGRQIGAAAVGVDFRNGEVYLAGGQRSTDLRNITNVLENTVDIFTSYNIHSRKWTTHPTLPAPRDHAGVGLVAGKLYVLGGRAFGHDNVVDTVFSYDLERGAWKDDLPVMPTPRGGVASGVLGEWILTAGGEGNPANGSLGVYKENQAFDTRGKRWVSLRDMDVPRHGTAGVAVGGKVYIPGGGTEKGGAPTSFFSCFEL
ncbi:kelch repeat-containing protein [Rutstroemia sp. NJR-2017a BVV2]|nr:kelch repeat-containing protein [Rutstroemia sp. NJR-2017a BVV2]